jgi:hypothetical protein
VGNELINVISHNGGNENVQATKIPACLCVRIPFLIALIITVAITGDPVNKHSIISCLTGEMRNI